MKKTYKKYDKPILVKYICKDEYFILSLKFDKVYTCIGERPEQRLYNVIDEEKEAYLYPMDLFELVEE